MKNARHAQAFRDSRKAMGFKNLQLYVPEDRVEELKLKVEMMRAEHYVLLTETAAPSSVVIDTLSQRYFAAMPSRTQREDVRAAIQGNKELSNLLTCVNDNIVRHNSLVVTLNTDIDLSPEQRLLAFAKAVAYSHLAVAQWNTILWATKVPPTGRVIIVDEAKKA